MLRDSVVVVVFVAVMCKRPRAIPLATITMRKSAHGFPFVSHIWDAYGAPLGGSLGHRSSAKTIFKQFRQFNGVAFQQTAWCKISCHKLIVM